MSILDSVMDATMQAQSGPRIIKEEHDLNKINWVRGLTDPGEMLQCGYLPLARRQANEGDIEYAARLQRDFPELIAELDKRGDVRKAAIRRAGYDTSNGRVNVMVAGEPAWAGLGVQIDVACDSEHAERLSGTDFPVALMPNHWFNERTGKMEEEPGHFTIVRTDTMARLGKCGSGYRVIQNRIAFKMIDKVLAEYGARYETAGSLHGGKKVFMFAHFPKQDFTINGGDNVKTFLAFFNDHTGAGGRAWCYPTAHRGVCDNTVTVSLKEDKHKGLGIAHRGNILEKIDDVREAVGLRIKSVDVFREQSEAMYHTPLAEPAKYFNGVLDLCMDMTQAKAEAGFDAFAATLKATQANLDLEAKRFEREQERRESLLESIIARHEGERCNFGNMKGTVWSGFNAVTEETTHGTVGQVRVNKDAYVQKAKRLQSILDGDANTMNQAALDVAMQLVAAR